MVYTAPNLAHAKVMTRREWLRLGGASLVGTTLFRSLAWAAEPAAAGSSRRLFFDLADVPRIRANASSSMLQPLLNTWSAEKITDLADALDRFETSGNIVRDFATVLNTFEHSLTLHLLHPNPQREAALLAAIERIIARPYWDYFRDAGEEVLGIQRASFATVRLLYAREVLGDAILPELDARLLQAIADKGCAACFATVNDMDHPDTVKGWDFDAEHAGFYDLTMRRWPEILGANNLRSAPTGALGLGALALRGHDPRAEQWLETAVASTRRFLRLLTPDGSYFEGLSYLDYSMRTAMPFIVAHQRMVGDIDWAAEVNWDGVLDYVMTMQLGRTPDGQPDIVNFSDARRSVFPGWISEVGQLTGNPLAGYVADHAGAPTWFYDVLWYRPDAPSAPPPSRLLNHRNDLNWIICRSGWAADDAVLAFKSGAPANHEHADRNHLIYKIHGERLLHDHLGAAYDRRTDGWTMRFTRGHNAVLIGGKGHHYVDGEHGTNESLAYATILNFEDHGDTVWWTSDATAAYGVVNEHVKQVLRTVIFAKPHIIVIHDQVRLRYLPQTFDARFFPDNADGAAQLTIDGPRFTLQRPNATLHGVVAAAGEGTAPRLARLEVKPETGDFPCVEVHAPADLTHEVVTVLAATSAQASNVPQLAAVRNTDGAWSIAVGTFNARLTPGAFEPTVVLG